MEPYRWTLREAAERLRNGELTAEAYVRSLLAQCDAHSGLNALVSLDPDRVLDAARRADRRRQEGATLGRLHGVPLVAKDCLDARGIPTTAATPTLRDNLPGRTATVLERLFDEGAFLLAKTNMHELAFGVTSNNELTGAVGNPHDPTRAAGGSSGGTAAAVGAKMAPAGFGTDTSGSSRIPAAHCGVVGFRPSTDRYPRDGIFPMNHSRDTAGLMARSVADVVLLDEIISGDASLSPPPLQSMRIGVPQNYFIDDLDDDVATAVAAELERLADQGVEVIEVEGPDFGAVRDAASGPMMLFEMPDDVNRYLEEVGSDLRFDDLVDGVASPYVESELVGIRDAERSDELRERYQRAISEILPRHREAYRTFFAEHDLDAIAFPTAPVKPAPLGENETILANGEEVSIWQTLHNTMPAALLGAPAISLPIGKSRVDLPVGLELDGLPGSDRELLSVAVAWEQSR